ncbi:MAG: sulfotransferase [Rhodobacteraceae bacterium]|nr:sulfotransferase [Paracoccaceae bacterium]
MLFDLRAVQVFIQVYPTISFFVSKAAMIVNGEKNTRKMKLASQTSPRAESEPLKEFLRPLLIRARIAVCALLSKIPASANYEPVYILGCGRSGTTVIGKSISQDADILYLNEPYYLWFNVTRRADFSNLVYGNGDCWLGNQDATPNQSRKSRRMLSSFARFNRRRFIVEKTPINSLRVDWIRAIEPRARFVVVKREWVDVVNSIHDLSLHKRYRLSGRPNLHPWWGEAHYKIRSLLSRDPYDLIGASFRHFVEERLAAGLEREVYLDMAVFEALACQVAIDRSFSEFEVPGVDYFEIHYDRFVESPLDEMADVVSWIKKGSPARLPSNALSHVQRRKKGSALSKAEILDRIHPDLRAVVEVNLS